MPTRTLSATTKRRQPAASRWGNAGDDSRAEKPKKKFGTGAREGASTDKPDSASWKEKGGKPKFSKPGFSKPGAPKPKGKFAKKRPE